MSEATQNTKIGYILAEVPVGNDGKHHGYEFDSYHDTLGCYSDVSFDEGGYVLSVHGLAELAARANLIAPGNLPSDPAAVAEYMARLGWLTRKA